METSADSKTEPGLIGNSLGNHKNGSFHRHCRADLGHIIVEKYDMYMYIHRETDICNVCTHVDKIMCLFSLVLPHTQGCSGLDF